MKSLLLKGFKIVKEDLEYKINKQKENNIVFKRSFEYKKPLAEQSASGKKGVVTLHLEECRYQK